MYGTEKHVLLRHYLEQGMSKAAIARELGVERRTIYRWIEAGELVLHSSPAEPSSSPPRKKSARVKEKTTN